MKKKVLGEVDGFAGKRDDFFDVLERKVATHGDSVLEIPLDKITIGDNVRTSEQNLDELADSIEAKGLLQPIVVIEAEPGRYRILFGHRRFRAHQILAARGLERFGKIAAVARKPEDFGPDEIHEIQIIENIQRENLSPLELKTALELLRAKGLSAKVISERIGKSEGYVKNLFMAVNTVAQNPEIKSMLDQKSPEVTLRDVLEVRVLPPKQQVEVLTEKLNGDIKTQAELVARVRSVKESLDSDHRARAEEKRTNPPPLFEVHDNRLRVKAIAFDFAKGTAEERTRLIEMLREVLARLKAEPSHG